MTVSHENVTAPYVPARKQKPEEHALHKKRKERKKERGRAILKCSWSSLGLRWTRRACAINRPTGLTYEALPKAVHRTDQFLGHGGVEHPEHQVLDLGRADLQGTGRRRGPVLPFFQGHPCGGHTSGNWLPEILEQTCHLVRSRLFLHSISSTFSAVREP